MRENCPYLEFFWSVFSRTRAEYGEVLRITPQSIFSLNTGKYGPEKLQIRKIFTQCMLRRVKVKKKNNPYLHYFNLLTSFPFNNKIPHRSPVMNILSNIFLDLRKELKIMIFTCIKISTNIRTTETSKNSVNINFHLELLWKLLQNDYVTCYNKKTNRFSSLTTFNSFLANVSIL